MRSRLRTMVAVVVGVVCGVVGVTAVRTERPVAELPAAGPVRATLPVPTPRSGVLLAWVPGGLPPGLVDRLHSAGGVMSTVLGDTVQLSRSFDAAGHVVDDLAPGDTVPLEAVAIECATWAPVMPVPEASGVCELDAGEGLLGATSARLRRIGPGGVLTIGDGRRVRVVGVVDDEAVGAAELVVPLAGAAALGVRTPRYVLVSYEGDRAAAEARLRVAAGMPAMRVRGPGETPWLRQGDAVLPQAIVKERFGEFVNRRQPGGRLVVDPGWRRDHLQTVDLPIVGRVTCHRSIVSALRGALEELAARGLLTTVDRAASGCWNPRDIAGTDQPSRHAWGIAIDLVPAPSDPAAVEVMERWGFTWGGRWVVPDPVHYEFVRLAKP